MSAEIPHSRLSAEKTSGFDAAESNTDYYEFCRRVAERLDSDTIGQLGHALHAIGAGGKAEPLALFGGYGSHALYVDRAANNIPTTPEDKSQIAAAYTNAFIVDAVNEVNTAIELAGSSLDEMRPATVAAKAHELIDATFQTRDQIIDEYDVSKFFSCYFLTLLSGDDSVYAKLSEKATNAFKSMNSASLNKRINEFVLNKPEKLTTVTHVYGDAATDMFNSYNIYNIFALLMGATSDSAIEGRIGKYRRAMLAFADQVTFNPAIRKQIDNASQLAGAPAHEASDEASVDWEVLPPGQLEVFAREIVETAEERSTGTRPSIDLSRLQILENIRLQHGVDVSYYAKGVRKARRIIREDGAEQADEYIMLILKRFNDKGQLMGEDAIAESPISGPNALYIQRQDVNGWDWKELMAYPKADVRAMGARSVKHEAPEGYDLVDWMTKKALTLLACSPDEFSHGEFKGVDAAGRPRLHIPRRVLSLILAQH